MCYDTGTSPKSLCSNPAYFRELLRYSTPKYVQLADPDHLAKVVGQGIMDIIINERYRIWIFAYLTEKTDTLLSALDHLSYYNCTIKGERGIIHVHYPTFSFPVSGVENFEFDILPGTFSNKEVLWQPREQDLITDITIADFEIKINRLHPDATLPQRATEHATGYDVTASDSVTIPPNSTTLVPLGFSMSFPSHLKCDLRPRSSLSLRGLTVSFGTIDPDYRGELKAILSNTTNNETSIHIGQRIGQLVFSPVSHPTISETESLSTTQRGPKGFGSTGNFELETFQNSTSKKVASPIFRPSLQTIPEIEPELKPYQASPTSPRTVTHDIATMPTTQLDEEISKIAQFDVEDVTPAPPPKEVFPDAIHLFPRTMYEQNQLNITGTEDQRQPEDDSHNRSTETEHLNPNSTNQPSPPLQTNAHDQSHNEAPPSPPNDNFSVASEGGPSDKGGTQHTPTVIIPESDLYTYLENDETVDDETLPEPNNVTNNTIYNENHQPFQSILDFNTQIKPRIPPEDRVSSTEPQTKTITTEYFQKCIGFRNISPILKAIKAQAKPTIQIRDTGKHPILSRGETATLPKYKHNSNPVPKPSDYGKIWHYDIVYGNGRAIGGILYALFFVDRYSRQKMIFGLKDLKRETIARAIKKFVRKVGFYPDELIADRDFKIIGEHVDDILEPFTQVSGAPSGRQSQNGLSEANWRYICNIARNYLVEHLLPPEFWYFAIKYAVQVSNYIPIKTTNTTLTTPYSLAYKDSPDYRKLIPLFSAAYVKIYKSGEGNTFETQTVKAILVGNDEKSNARLFYNPDTKKIMASSDYRLNISCPSGPIFHLEYTEPTAYSLYNDSVVADAPTFNIDQKVYLSPTHLQNPLEPAKIIDIPFRHNDPYSVQLEKDKSIVQVMAFDILPYNPNSQESDGHSPLLQHPWLKHNAKVTLFLSDKMPQPKHGILVQSGNDFYFHQGHSLKNKSKSKTKKTVQIHLPPDITELEKLIDAKKLCKGWQNQKTVLQNIQNAETFNPMQTTDPRLLTDTAIKSKIDTIQQPEIIGFANKVSAKTLSSNHEPKLHEHDQLPPADKEIWDQSYLEEYMGLHSETQTWEYITEEEYKSLRPLVGNALPTMAISKIKTDENGDPLRAKYRIVVLGNLDPHDWSNNDCFAPVLSARELRLLIAIATQMKVIPKTGDVSQAFVQSVLPDSEKYVIRPPKGCPLTPPNTYLLLKKTLYGLKRSPRHWYETCKNTLIQLGLKPCPNAPCIFTGTIIEDEPPLYLGLFVDDFIFFSESPSVESKFQELFGQHYKVDFDPEVTHFLGIKFTNITHPDGHVDIYMTQPKDSADLIEKAGLDQPQTKTVQTPYRSGFPVDTIPDMDMSQSDRDKTNKKLQELVGSLNWISTQTRPDISTITNMIAQYNSKASPGHIEAAKYAIRYLKGTQNMGIKFSSKAQSEIESFVQFPLPPTKLQTLSDSNWGPQDQSVPSPDDDPIYLELFKTRSIAGHVIWLGGPLDWCSKRQSYTARSSPEAEIGAVDECVKTIQQLINILKDLQLYDRFISGPVPVYNDNAAAVQWSYNMTTKGLRYIQIRENAVRENIQAGTVSVKHITGKTNPSDIFTKEDRDVAHYIQCRDSLCSTPPDSIASSFTR